MNKKYKKIILVIIIIMIIITSIFLIKKYYCNKKHNNGEELFVNLYLSQENKVIKLQFEDYIIGTVAAEMPASFEFEALKAQAVCARTYALKKITNSQYPMGADLSDNISECQAYISPSEFSRRHGNNQFFLNKISRAVKETQGEIIIYNNEPIDALYHSTCGGSTESAVHVWSKKIPYLQSVKCEYCSKSRFYSTVQVFSAQELHKLTNIHNSDLLDIQIIKKTPTGRIRKVKIDNKILSGEEMRNILNLPSNWWSFKKINDKIIFNNHGYGHGVGMCQYGANGMAKEGKNYRQILMKYYQNIEFSQLNYD